MDNFSYLTENLFLPFSSASEFLLKQRANFKANFLAEHWNFIRNTYASVRHSKKVWGKRLGIFFRRRLRVLNRSLYACVPFGSEYDFKDFLNYSEQVDKALKSDYFLSDQMNRNGLVSDVFEPVLIPQESNQLSETIFAPFLDIDIPSRCWFYQFTTDENIARVSS